MNKQATCPICCGLNISLGHTLHDDRYGYPGGFQLLKCESCGHQFLQGEFSADLLGYLYSNYYPRSTISLEAYKPHTLRVGLKSWLDGARSAAYRWVPRNVKVLDIGCGFGESLGYHQSRGCEVYGVDADENIRRVAEKFGFNVHVGLFDPMVYEPDSFDYVTLSQVIEHVTDPIQVLHGIARVLKPGGTLILSTPNAGGWGASVFGKRWINWHTPYHLQFFSSQSLRLAAEQAGLSLTRVETITSSDWLCYQWIHLVSYPKEGIPSSFWSLKPRNLSLPQELMRKLIMASKLILLPQLITRMLDSIGRGDNFLIVLKKKPVCGSQLQ